MSCRCAPSLSGMGLNTTNMTRQLSSAEIAGFLFRHPVVAAQIAETEAFMKSGFYDYDYNPATQWRFPGVIPPWGMQVEDSYYGLVTIFPARDGTWRYAGYSAVDLGTDKPDYTSDSGNSFSQVLADAVSALSFPLLVIGAVYLYTHRKGGS